MYPVSILAEFPPLSFIGSGVRLAINGRNIDTSVIPALSLLFPTLVSHVQRGGSSSEAFSPPCYGWITSRNASAFW